MSGYELVAQLLITKLVYISRCAYMLIRRNAKVLAHICSLSVCFEHSFEHSLVIHRMGLSFPAFFSFLFFFFVKKKGFFYYMAVHHGSEFAYCFALNFFVLVDVLCITNALSPAVGFALALILDRLCSAHLAQGDGLEHACF